MNDLEDRINELEMKFSYQDQVINDLNSVVTEQQQTIESLLQIVKSLTENNSENGDHNTSLKNDLPPHY